MIYKIEKNIIIYRFLICLFMIILYMYNIYIKQWLQDFKKVHKKQKTIWHQLEIKRRDQDSLVI